MNNYELDFGENTVGDVTASTTCDMIFNGREFAEQGREIGQYARGNFSLFFNHDYEVGYKIFISFNKTWIEHKPFQVCGLAKIMELKRIYDILHKHGLAPKVREVFSSSIYFDNHREEYVSYGLKMQRIVGKKEGPEEEKRAFSNRLSVVCADNGIVRLSMFDRSRLRQGRRRTGSVTNIIKETFKKRLCNCMHTVNGYILVDIDPMWVIHKGMVKKEFVF